MGHIAQNYISLAQNHLRRNRGSSPLTPIIPRSVAAHNAIHNVFAKEDLLATRFSASA